MAIDFPNNPNNNDLFSSAGKEWRWDGTTWKLQTGSAVGLSRSDFSVTTNAGGTAALQYSNSTGVFSYTPPDLSGYALTNHTHSYELNDLSDVNTSGAANEKYLRHNGSSWVVSNGYELPTATTAVLGGVKVDGTTIQINSGVISSPGGASTSVNITNEVSDNTCFPIFASDATGGQNLKSNTGLKFNSQSGQLEAGSFKKTGGASSEFLKADGSIDSTTYLSSVSLALNDLSDVNTTGAANGKIIKHNGISWVIADDSTGGGGGSSNFTGLSDTPTTLTANKWLKVNAGATALEFTDAPSGGGSSNFLGLSDTPGSFVQSQLLRVNAAGNALEFIAGNIEQLANVQLSASPQNGDFLRYNGSSWENTTYTPPTPTLTQVLAAGSTTTSAATVGNFTCSNLTVTGTTTTINSNTVNIGDNILVLNSDETGTPSQNGGLEIERGTSTNVSLRWNETSDKWQYTNDGTNFSDIGSSTTDTTYNISCVDGANANEEKIRLNNEINSTTDDIVLEAGTGLSIARSGDKITFANTVSNSNTTYDLSAGSSGANATITLWDGGSPGAGNGDVVTLSGGGGTTFSITGNNIRIDTIGSLGSLNDVNFTGSPATGSILEWNDSSSQWDVVAGGGVPAGTIVMYNGTTAPSGWALCDGGGTRPDLRNKFVVGAGSSYNLGANAGSADAVVVSHNHGTTGNQSANHTHAPGNSMATNFTGDHFHQQSGSGSGTTGTQSANHYHTIGSNKPDGSAGTWIVNTDGGGQHTHPFNASTWDNQGTYFGPQRSGGGDSQTTYNTGNASNGNHSHQVNLNGVTTGGVDVNHTHNFNFNISGATTYSSIGNHAHNINGNTGNESANHTHNINAEGVSGTGKNLPPYWALTYIIKL